MADMTCLAEGLVFPADPAVTGINLNEIVVGPTGCGKSWSNAYSRLAHTFESSVVVPIAKKAIKEKFAAMFMERGYNVVDLDFAHPEKCDHGYDPMDYIHSDEDAINLAKRMTSVGTDSENRLTDEAYWNDSSASLIGALIALVRINAEDTGVRASFADVIRLYRCMKTYTDGGVMRTNLDGIFETAAREHPGNQASTLWKTFSGISIKTASCIFSILNSAMDKIMMAGVEGMLTKEHKIDFRDMGQRKTALFITTSPMNKALQGYVNVLYGDMFRELFESAESLPSGRLEIPVHVICDDFACGSRILDFEDYISVFRAAGISVTLLIQSESQLAGMYGKAGATTIINNCDTYVYMGGMDIETCQSVSQRVNRPINRVMELPLEQVIVFRRGSRPVEARRYQILADPLYRKVQGLDTENDTAEASI